MNSGKLIMKFFVVVFCTLITVFIFSSCKDEPTQVENIPAESSVSGTLTFVDGTPGVNAVIHLTLGYTEFKDTTDSNGKFSFSNLQRGTYTVTFKSTDYTINTSQTKFYLSDYQDVTQNLYIRYRMIDEFKAITMNNDVVFFSLQPEAGKIGTNYTVINYLSGFFRRDYFNRASLNFEIYKIPSEFSWLTPGQQVTPDYVKQNFEYLTEVSEEPVSNYNHEVRFSGDKIPIILSDPPNGFAFVKKDSTNKELKIPCVDFNNNDFGLTITYK